MPVDQWATPDRPGLIRMTCENPPLNLWVRLGPDLPQLTGGVGGWETSNRPRQVGMTVWQGVGPFEATVNLILDGLRKHASQERAISKLLDVARGTDDTPPGPVRLLGLVGFPRVRWLINGIDWGDAIRRKDMERVRQIFTLSLVEYQPPEYSKLARGALSKPKQRTVIYTVRKGDTPAKIARARRCKWTDLRAINRKGLIVKANQHLKPGTRINVPVKRTPAKKKKK